LLERSGYTTHARTLSDGPVRIMAYSPWRGDFASRSATVVAPAGIERHVGCSTVDVEDADSWPAMRVSLRCPVRAPNRDEHGSGDAGRGAKATRAE
jgi:hypothetical protein